MNHAVISNKGNLLLIKDPTSTERARMQARKEFIL